MMARYSHDAQSDIPSGGTTKSEEAWKLDANKQLYIVYMPRWENMVISVVTSQFPHKMNLWVFPILES